MIKRYWETLAEKIGSAARLGLVVGLAAILLFMGLGVFWLLRSDYQPLFTELTAQDTASMTAELDRQKIPYTLSEQGNNAFAILVDKNDVYKTRIKLMGKEIPLHGTVGFELFNNSDFGMTEFAQKINYQRALQGELTRTIQSLSEIRDARVLLALPEQGLFKQATNKPKASVTIGMKPGQRLRAEQITGIQRLVSSAVPNIAAQDVTIVDQNGVALTRMADNDTDGMAGGTSSRLDLKKETEAYLSRKALEVLERALGPGQAMASVDVTLDMERLQSSTDEVLSSPGKAEGAPTGVIVKERETSRDSEAPLNARSAPESAGGVRGGSSQSEVEYAVGHHVQQAFTPPGSIRRIQVAVVVQKALNSVQQEQLRTMVAACIGASPERGDSVVVQTLDGLLSPGETVQGAPGLSSPQQKDGSAADPAQRSSQVELDRAGQTWPLMRWTPGWPTWIALLVFVGICGFLARRRSAARKGRAPAAALTEAERRAALVQVRAWMSGQQRDADSPGRSGGLSEGAL